jgi:ankyrin repeat protein
MIRELAKLGADVNIPTNDGYTPVYIAAKNGDQDVVNLLKEYGA